MKQRLEDTPLSIEEKYDEVRQLISIGKEKGYLLYDEVNELLPADITSSDELDDLFSTFGSAGIEVVDSEKAYRDDKLLDRTGEGAEELELDLTPGALDKTNDPVRMYLREMGTVPLLTREGEVEIAKRIERGKLAVIKSISRTPTVAHAIMTMGDQLKNDERSVRELVIFQDEEITDDKIEERKRQVLRQIEAVRKASLATEKCKEKLDKTREGHDDPREAEVPQGALGGAARPHRAVTADAEDRVHGDRQAAPHRPPQGGGRGRDAAEARGRSHRAAAEPEEQEGPASRKKRRRTCSGGRRTSSCR